MLHFGAASFNGRRFGCLAQRTRDTLDGSDDYGVECNGHLPSTSRLSSSGGAALIAIDPSVYTHAARDHICAGWLSASVAIDPCSFPSPVNVSPKSKFAFPCHVHAIGEVLSLAKTRSRVYRRQNMPFRTTRSVPTLCVLLFL